MKKQEQQIVEEALPSFTDACKASSGLVVMPLENFEDTPFGNMLFAYAVRYALNKGVKEVVALATVSDALVYGKNRKDLKLGSRKTVED